MIVLLYNIALQYTVLTTAIQHLVIIIEMMDIMESLNISVCVDANDKKNFEQFCENVGMNVPTAIKMFIKVVKKKKKLPLEIRSKSFSDTIYETLQEAELEMDKNPKRYSKEDVIDSINKI